MRIIVKDFKNDNTQQLDVEPTITIQQLIEYAQLPYGSKLICAGKIISTYIDKTLTESRVKDGSVIIVITKTINKSKRIKRIYNPEVPAQPETHIEPVTQPETHIEPVTQPETHVEPVTQPETHVEPVTQPETHVEPVTQPETQVPEPTTQQAPHNVHRYNGGQVMQAIRNDPFIIVNLLQLLAQQNPFILSYIATAPDRVVQELNNILEDESFSMVVEGQEDPIERALTTIESVPSGLNQFQIDQRNIDHIMTIVNHPQMSRSYVKEIYLMMDRNIEATLSMLN